MAYYWYINQKVECINDSGWEKEPQPTTRGGEIYTISGFMEEAGEITLLFHELNNGMDVKDWYRKYPGWTYGFDQANFRPITDISQFTEISTTRELEEV